MTKTIKLELSDDEINQIRYALDELANKRQEQSIDWAKPHLQNEAEYLRKLRSKITEIWISQ